MTKISLIQTLLNAEATIANHQSDPVVRGQLLDQIVELRGADPPHCHGHDDCSTNILSMCPWRTDCGEKAEILYHQHKKGSTNDPTRTEELG